MLPIVKKPYPVHETLVYCVKIRLTLIIIPGLTEPALACLSLP